MNILIYSYDIDQLLHRDELFKVAFPTGGLLLSQAYGRWLYGDNPFGLARMVKAIDLGQLIGFMAMVPLRLARRDAQVPAYNVVDVVVHPDYRGQNVFGRMIASAEQMAIAEDAILIGYPNAMAVNAWRRAGMHFQTPLRPYLVAPTLPARGLHAAEIQDSQALEPALVLLRDQALRGDDWRLSLSADYVDWRYLRHPVHRYKIQQIEVGATPAGFLVSRRVRGPVHLLVGDFTIDRFARERCAACPFRPSCSSRTTLGASRPVRSGRCP